MLWQAIKRLRDQLPTVGYPSIYLSADAFSRRAQRALLLGSLLASLLLAACASSTARPAVSPAASPTPTAMPGPTPAAYNSLRPEREGIYFQIGQGQRWTTAFRLATDLGLHPSLLCNGQLTMPGQTWRDWVPLVPPDYQTGAISMLFVELTPLTAPDWPARVRALSVVRSVRFNDGIGCTGPILNQGTPPPGALAYLGPGQDGTVVRVSFAAPLDSYDVALVAAVNLGLRLADPCYEHARPAPPWHPMGQEDAFAASHTLVVATTENASNQWQAQLKATAGVSAVTTPYTPTC